MTELEDKALAGYSGPWDIYELAAVRAKRGENERAIELPIGLPRDHERQRLDQAVYVLTQEAALSGFHGIQDAVRVALDDRANVLYTGKPVGDRFIRNSGATTLKISQRCSILVRIQQVSH